MSEYIELVAEDADLQERVGYELNLGLSDLDAHAKGRNLEVVRWHPRVLQLDLDSPSALVEHRSLRRILGDKLPNRFTGHELFTAGGGTPGHCHIYLLTATENTMHGAITLQLVLGSDRKREIMNVARLDARGDAEIVLFETREARAEYEEWLAKGLKIF